MLSGSRKKKKKKKTQIIMCHYSLKMNFCNLFRWYFVLLLLFVVVGHGSGQGTMSHLNDCRESRCGRHGPPIRFPFRLKDRQPEHCGYPGFALTCTDNNRHTLLELPTSAKLHIDSIDYASQAIVASDPDGCLPRQLLNFDLSSSPFQFGYMFDYDYAFFNCSSIDRKMYLSMPCLSVPAAYDVYAFVSDMPIADATLTSCTKMYNLRSVPQEFISRDNILHLNWSVPVCPSCEAQGKYCGWKNNITRTEIVCFDRPKATAGTIKKIVASVTTLGSFLVLLLLFAVLRIYINKKSEQQNQARIEQFLEDYKAFKPTRYLYDDIKRITNDFEDKLGQGAYGTVFKGKLSDEIFVAVKILNSSIGNGEEFVNEVGTMGRIHHINVVRLVGYCADGFRRALVYEYLPNDSLEKFISPGRAKNHHLGWEKLQYIALGIAKGIEYLHQGCDQRILHFDIKPHNILLDDNFNPKISDFGLAKLCSKDQSAVSMTTARGTMGYIAPEVFSRNFGNVSYKSDVYSFGMVLLEMVGGREHTSVTVDNTSQINFPEWAYKCLDQGEELRIQIEEEDDAHIARKLTIVGLWCIQWHPMDRPPMKTVVQMLEGEGIKLTMPPNPFASSGSAKMNGNMPGRTLHQELATIAETE